MGWHGSGYYATFVMKSPPRNNLRVVEYKVTDKKTGKVVGLMTADANNNDNIWREWLINNQEVVVGDTLVVTAKVKNMVQANFEGRPTKYTPIRMTQMASFDDDSLILGKWNTAIEENVIPGVNADPATRISKINVGQVVTFDKTKNDSSGEILQWEFKVPNDVKNNSFWVLRFLQDSSSTMTISTRVTTMGDFDSRLKKKISDL